jgi:hypothetical protein
LVRIIIICCKFDTTHITFCCHNTTLT